MVRNAWHGARMVAQGQQATKRLFIPQSRVALQSFMDLCYQMLLSCWHFLDYFKIPKNRISEIHDPCRF